MAGFAVHGPIVRNKMSLEWKGEKIKFHFLTNSLFSADRRPLLVLGTIRPAGVTADLARVGKKMCFRQKNRSRKDK